MEIVHETERNRFLVRTEDGEAELAYMDRHDQVLDLMHTFVPRGARGQGIGEAMVERAFDYAREHGYRIRPTCAFVRAWLVQHPERREQLVS